jgi:hypothetical protein
MQTVAPTQMQLNVMTVILNLEVVVTVIVRMFQSLAKNYI